MKKALITTILTLLFLSFASAQLSAPVHIQILKAEDARRYDKTLEDLMSHADERVKIRAILAAGRIGDEKAIPQLAPMLENGSVKVREMAAFALGEIESANAADAIIKSLADPKTPEAVRARAVEAAGKIAAANPKDAKAKNLGEAILDTLEAEDTKGGKQDRDVVLLALTAALRARPEDSDLVVAKFLTNLDARIRADAANTLSRLRAKNANIALRGILLSDDDPVARANAARALGAAEDKDSFDMLLVAATEDDDSRVRVSAIRALASLKDAMAVDKLLDHGEKLLGDLKRSKREHPGETNELLEITSVLGRLVPNTNDGRTLKFLQTLRERDKFRSPETEIAFARVSPEKYANETNPAVLGFKDPWAASAYAQGIQVLAVSSDAAVKTRASAALTRYASTKYGNFPAGRIINDTIMIKAMPDIIRAFAAFKPAGLDAILRNLLTNDDVFIRATAAELIAGQPLSAENITALVKAASRAIATDKFYNDAQLGILDALYKLDKKQAVGSLVAALDSPDYLVRKKAFELLADKDLYKDFPGIPASLENARRNKKDQVLPYNPTFGTKLGQMLNSDADYRRAAARKNGNVKALITTGKGTFTIDLLPEDAPLTVDNFIKLARSNYFNGIEVHRVVPNFVMQDGDPRGDGNGGPGWSIRCEINMVPFDRGAVGMALSGKDTGGSQWFVTHSPQPHLDGGYTVFGRVNESGMKVVDNIVRGDKIVSMKIIEGISPQRRRVAERRKNLK